MTVASLAPWIGGAGVGGLLVAAAIYRHQVVREARRTLCRLQQLHHQGGDAAW